MIESSSCDSITGGSVERDDEDEEEGRAFSLACIRFKGDSAAVIVPGCVEYIRYVLADLLCIPSHDCRARKRVVDVEVDSRLMQDRFARSALSSPSRSRSSEKQLVNLSYTSLPRPYVRSTLQPRNQADRLAAKLKAIWNR